MLVHNKRGGSKYLSAHQHQAHSCIGAFTAELKSSLQFNPGEPSKKTPALLYPPWDTWEPVEKALSAGVNVCCYFYIA